MSTIFLTILLAFFLVLIAIGFLAISWLITGKSKIRPGACGRDPTKDKECLDKTISCSLCKKDEKK